MDSYGLNVDGSVFTLSDAVNKLQHRAGQLESEARSERMLLFALRDALRDIPTMFDWKYYQRVLRINPSSSLSIQSLTYNASSKQVTISDAESSVWPSDAAYGEVAIDGVRYSVASRTSDKVAVVVSGPSANRVGKAEWSRSTYQIPMVRRVHSLWEEGTTRPIDYISPQLIHERDSLHHYAGTPVFYTISAGARECSIRFSPAPSTTRPLVLSTSTAPAYPSVFRDATVCTGTAGSTTVTATAPKSKWIGSVIRLSANPTDPDDGRQKLIDGDYEWQAIVTGVSGNNLTVSSPLPRNVTDEYCIVSSVVDVSITMQTFFENLAYEYFCRSHRHDGLQDAMQITRMSQRDAQAADAIANRGDQMSVDIYRLWPIADLKYSWLTSP